MKKKTLGMRMPKLTIEEMAEVFELRDKGVSWVNLSMIFNISDTTIKKYYRNAQRFGFYYWTDWRD